MLVAILTVLIVLSCFWVVPKITRRSRLVMAIEPVKPLPITRDQIVQNARAWVGVPYALGGNSQDGVDCSTFVSAVAWNNEYYTTDLMYRISHRIEKEDLQAGDALNIPEPGEKGHICLFDHWTDEERTRVWVYDSSEACGGVCYREIDYDERWVPIRYKWVIEETPAPTGEPKLSSREY